MGAASNHDPRTMRGCCAVCGRPIEGEGWQVRDHQDLALEDTCSLFCASQALARSRQASRATPINVHALRLHP